MASTLSLPAPLHSFFSYFPLYTHPPVPSPTKAKPPARPTLWILPPPRNADSDLLSTDVECLKWQAYLALRGLSDIAVRWDVSSDGGIDGRLPNLHVPKQENDHDEAELLPAHLIPGWVDSQVGDTGPLEGYADEAAKDESRAWVALLEGNVHAALVLFQPKPVDLLAMLSPYSSASRSLAAMFNPPPAPLTGISSLLPPYGTHVDRTAVELQYKEAISSLSERLGTDKWFLGSSGPTALDALIFAYLHSILHSNEYILRFEVTRRVNLVAWERRVQGEVRAAFHQYQKSTTT